MNNMTEWKSGRYGLVENIKYRTANEHEIDDLVFLSRAISVISEQNYTEFVFLKPDLITFISVVYRSNGSIEAAEWINKRNPYIYIFRNECGQLQSGSNKHE